MKAETGKCYIFHVSPWRLLVPWLIFGPLIIFFLILASKVPLAQQGEKEGLWLIAGFFTIVAYLVCLLIRRARLEITDQTIRLRQPGYTLETTWTNIGGMLSARGAESLVTREAMAGKGCQRLNAAAQIGRGLVIFYDEERVELIAQHRLIPIESFAWHLRKGRRLGSVMLRVAPQLQADIEALASKRT